MISSTKNDQVKMVVELRKKVKARNEAGLFVAEGLRMVSELPLERAWRLYVSESFLKNRENAGLLERFSRYEIVTDQVFSAMSDTQTPQGILALAKQYEYGLSDLLSAPGPAHLMILENLQDPGNLGTILRARRRGRDHRRHHEPGYGGYLQSQGGPLHHGLRLPRPLSLYGRPSWNSPGAEGRGDPAVCGPSGGKE